ncbi:hypothetical protein Q7P37_005458 [Cladosporium fusiforme]
MAPSDYPKREHFNLTFPSPYIAQVEISRAEKLNAFTEPMVHSLGAIFTQLSSDPDVRAILLTGSGPRAFTAGLDVQSASESGPLAQNSPESELDTARKAVLLRRHILQFQDSVSAVERCEKPVIAVLHGISYGIALDITTCCDVRYCSRDVRFAVKEVDIGLAADVGTLTRLPKANLPMSWIKEVAFTARDIGADEALRVGLVSGVFESRDLAFEGALELAKKIAQKSPVAVQATKEILNFSRDHSVQDGLNYVAAYNMSMVQSTDVKDAMLAGLKKTKPKFAKL